VKKHLLLLAGVALATGLFVGAQASLAAGKPITVTGTVTITEDDDWNITAVMLTEDSGAIYHITMDAKGKALGSDMDGNKVSVTGMLAEKDGAKWLTVANYKAVEED
jgi:hypothetical protein